MAGNSPCVECDFGKKLKSREYLQENRHAQGFNGMKILFMGNSLSAKRFLSGFCSPCLLLENNHTTGTIDSEYRCGEAGVLVVTTPPKDLSSTDVEELAIRISAQTKW